MATDKGMSLGWDDEITLSDDEFVLFEPGEYDYVVKAFERSWYDGSDNIEPCNQAKLTLACTDPKTGQVGTVFCNLFCNTKVAWRITQFFKSCGLVPADAHDGDRVRLTLFSQCVGRSGRVRLKRRTYNGKEYNDVDRFLKPGGPVSQAAPAPQTAPAPSQQWGGGGF